VLKSSTNKEQKEKNVELTSVELTSVGIRCWKVQLIRNKKNKRSVEWIKREGGLSVLLRKAVANISDYIMSKPWI